MLIQHLTSTEVNQPIPFITRISDEIPGFAELPPLRRIDAVRNWVYANTDIAVDQKALLPYDKYPLHALKIEELMELHDRNTGGHFCAGINYWMYSYGDETSLTHAVALVEVEGNLYAQDAYFNLTYVDQHDQPVPFYTMLENLLDGREPKIKTGDSRFRDVHLRERVPADGGWAVAGILTDTCKTLGEQWSVCKSQTSSEAFLANFSDVQKAYAFLAEHGLPKSRHYLSLFPLGVTGEGWIDDPTKSDILTRVVAIRDKALQRSRMKPQHSRPALRSRTERSSGSRLSIRSSPHGVAQE
jgi:hypothetical protein